MHVGIPSITCCQKSRKIPTRWHMQLNNNRTCLHRIGLALVFAGATSCLISELPNTTNAEPIVSLLTQEFLPEKCCQAGKTKAIADPKFACKSNARDVLLSSDVGMTLLFVDNALKTDPSLADKCEMMLESCCMAQHRTKNCQSGKQFAKSGSTCMDVELSKVAMLAVESFNDCCMACSLGVLAAKNPSINETLSSSRVPSLAARCKLSESLEKSLSGQLYEKAYLECCEENLPHSLSSLMDTNAKIDCKQSNSCSQKCVSKDWTIGTSSELLKSLGDRCDCFAGYKLASDGFNCVDIDECELNLHTCNLSSEVCDNTRGGFRCLARTNSLQHIPVAPLPFRKTSDAWPFLFTNR